MLTIEKSKGKNKVVQIVVPWTTGLQTLPEPGGMLDQPYRQMVFFENFITGDRNATHKRINAPVT